MRLTLVFDHRFRTDASGRVFSPQWYNREMLAERYLTVFDSLTILARLDPFPSPNPANCDAEEPRIRVCSVGDWRGPRQLVARSPLVHAWLRAHLAHAEAIILFVPSVLGLLATPYLAATRRPYGVEVVGDPHEALSAASGRIALRLAYQKLWTEGSAWTCRNAATGMYVTSNALQRRFPLGAGAASFAGSDVNLSDEAFRDPPAIRDAGLRLINVATFSRAYKGQHVLVEAVAKCVAAGEDLRLVLVGDGCLRHSVQQLAVRRGISDRVSFLGQLPAGGAVRRALDDADVFVLPSLTEGMPRALIEAMARALPAIASDVGGVSELLPSEDRVPPGDVETLAAKLRALAGDRARLRRMAQHNRAKANEFRQGLLSERRHRFLTHLRELSAPGVDRRECP